MQFRALDNGEQVSFERALSKGIASDGSLYFPTEFPRLDENTIKNLPNMTQQEVAGVMLGPWVLDEMSQSDLDRIISTASTFETPVVNFGNKRILELTHGPTLAFKDVAARYLAAFMGHFNQVEGRKSIVLTATSGDTGGAIANGFAGIAGVEVVILYPKGKVSSMQQEQLRRTASNVSALEVDGVFDDCQDLVKKAFLDSDLKGLNLSSANSISIGRVLPQMTYYADALRQIPADDRPDGVEFIVPTGNLGNLTAGMFAMQMGLPIRSFVAANNENDAVARFVHKGDYEPEDTIETISNAMDVGKPNNFPRFLELINMNDGLDLNPFVRAIRISDDETVKTIKDVYDEHGYLLDPHTAVAWHASEMMNCGKDSIVISTAAPEKFAEEIFELTGIEVDNSAVLKKLRDSAPEEYTEVSSNYADFKKYLKSRA